MQTELYFADGLLLFLGIVLMFNMVLLTTSHRPALHRAARGVWRLMSMPDDDFYCFFHRDTLIGRRSH